MSRVMLFVQDRDELPKVTRSWRSWRPEPDVEWVPKLLAWRAQRWWLVECENADAGRRAIAVFERWDDVRRLYPFNGGAGGRILASNWQPTPMRPPCPTRGA